MSLFATSAPRYDSDMGESVRLESAIDRVVVYRRGARVTRTAPLASLSGKLPASASVGGLPLAIDDASIRVRVTSSQSGAALPVAVDMRVILEVAAIDPSLPPPESPELRAARRRVDSLGGELARLAEEQSRVSALEHSSRPEGRRGEPPPPSPFESRMALSAFIAERDAKLRAAIASIGEALMIAEEELSALTAREREASSERQRRREELTKSVVVTLDDGNPDIASLQVSYVVAGARWCPTYTMHLSARLGTTRLAVRGTVFQATGEDWRGVEMLLSTAEPERWHELPTLSSLRIGKRQQRPSARGWRPPPTGADALFLAYDRGRPEPLDATLEPAVTRATRWLGPGAPASGLRRSVQRLEPIRDDDEDTMVNRPEARALDRVAPMGSTRRRLAQRDAETDDKPKAAMEQSALAASNTAMPDVHAFQAQAMAPARHAMPTAGRAKGGGGLLSGLGELLSGSGGGGASLDEDYGSAMPMAPAGAPQSRADLPLAKPRPTPVADEPFLAFDALRMAGADEPERGTLVVVETRERYVEELVRARGTAVRETVLVALDHALDAASRRFAEIADRALPPRCASPDSALGFDYAYPTSSRVDVPSDGSFHSVPLAEQDCPAQLRHVVVPRESTDVYRIVELDNPIDAPLLDGPVDVYVAGRYLVTSDIHCVPAGARLSIGIGVEQRVKVARNCRYSEETEGLMRGTIALKHEIAVELSSHLDEPCDLEVRERVPTTVENDDEVRVDPGKVDPAWEVWDPKVDVGPPLRGGYRWRLTLPKGEKRTLSASYTIRTSSKNELVGGNRRES